VAIDVMTPPPAGIVKAASVSHTAASVPHDEFAAVAVLPSVVAAWAGATAASAASVAAMKILRMFFPLG
jgi:hypothetical protein